MSATHFSGPIVSTNGFTGALTGNVTGNVTGAITATTASAQERPEAPGCAERGEVEVRVFHYVFLWSHSDTACFILILLSRLVYHRLHIFL